MKSLLSCRNIDTETISRRCISFICFFQHYAAAAFGKSRCPETSLFPFPNFTFSRGQRRCKFSATDMYHIVYIGSFLETQRILQLSFLFQVCVQASLKKYFEEDKRMLSLSILIKQERNIMIFNWLLVLEQRNKMLFFMLSHSMPYLPFWKTSKTK